MPSAKPYVGIDLGGTNMQVGVVSADLKMLSRAKRKTKPDEGRDVKVVKIVFSFCCSTCGRSSANLSPAFC